MNQLEYLRQKLYGEIELGNVESILRVSQQLDELIVCYTANQIIINRKSA